MGGGSAWRGGGGADARGSAGPASTSSSPSQIHTLLSRLQLAKSLPSKLHSALLHSLSCPSSGSTASHSASAPAGAPSSRPASSTCCQIPTVESKLAVASVVPVGEKARDRTVRWCDVGIEDWYRNA